MTEKEIEDKINIIKGILEDSAGNVLYYDRKEDEDLGVGEIQYLIAKGYLSKDQFMEMLTKPYEDLF